MRRPWIPTLALLALAPACLSLTWERDSLQSPPPAELGTLQAGTTTLGEALDRLGAPLAVYEYRQTGVALAYGWYRADTKGVRVSVPLYERASASLDYSNRRDGMQGLLLVFDQDLRLVWRREGWLAELTAGFERQPPGLVDEPGDDPVGPGAPPAETDEPKGERP